MTAKQIPGSNSAPDGSTYITLTDGNGNLVTAGGGGGGLTVGTTTITSGTSGQFLYDNGGILGNQTLGTRTSNESISNPTGTTNTAAYVMCGIAQTFTPVTSGKVLVFLSGKANNATAADGIAIQMAYGTGTAPINGATATGTVATGLTINSTNSMFIPFTLVALVTGLTLGTAYWFDLQQEAFVGGTASLYGLSYVAVEV